jgi:hypothetical protein
VRRGLDCRNVPWRSNGKVDICRDASLAADKTRAVWWWQSTAPGGSGAFGCSTPVDHLTCCASAVIGDSQDRLSASIEPACGGSSFSQRPSLTPLNSVILHTPLAHGHGLDATEHEPFHGKADQDHGQQAGEHVRCLQRIASFEDVPAEAGRTARDAEHEFGGDQRSPSERPADLEAGQN